MRNPWTQYATPTSRIEAALHASQTLLAFLALCCTASLAAFQTKWRIPVSGLNAFLLLLEILLLVTPIVAIVPQSIAARTSALQSTASFLRAPRVRWVISGSGTGLSLIAAIATSASVFSQPGCRDPWNDPHAKLGPKYRDGLGGWCTTKKATAVFFWLLFFAWLALLLKIAYESYKSRSIPYRTKRSPPSDEEETVPIRSTTFNTNATNAATANQHTYPETTVHLSAFPLEPAPSQPYNLGMIKEEENQRGHGWRSIPFTSFRPSSTAPTHEPTTDRLLDSPPQPQPTRPSYRLPSHSFSHLSPAPRRTPTPGQPAPPTAVPTQSPIDIPVHTQIPPHVAGQPGISRTMILATTQPDDPYGRSRAAMGGY